MNIRHLGVLAGFLILGTAGAAPKRPLIPLFDAATITARCDSELAKARATKTAIESEKGADVFADWDRLSIQYADFAYPVYLLHQTVIVMVAFVVVRWEAGVGVKFGAVILVTAYTGVLSWA